MKKSLLLTSLLAGGLFSMNAQTVLFEDSFETYDDFIITGIGDWITIDLDGLGTYSGGGGQFDNQFDPKAFMVFNPTTAGVTNADSGTELRNFDPKTGNKYVGCWASNGGANNDWIVSPSITLGANGNTVKFWVKSMSSSYGLENYKVGVYVGNGTPATAADFTIISGAQPLTAPYPNWEEKTLNLDAYAGQTIRIGINCVSDDKYFFMVDDFSVTTTSASIQDNLATSFSVYPNPATNVLNISNTIGAEIQNITLTDLNGRAVKRMALNGAIDAQINVADLNTGVYFVNIETNNGSISQKFVKK